ncbi:MAG: hypothetical protein JJE03_05990 [Peptostreptococcaceae bacterium]|nr:hypothetical protein [Peptostreptococcaceae bacterium]
MKKLLFVFIVLVLITSVFTGCSSTGGKADVTVDNMTAVEQLESAANALALRQYIYARLKTEEFLSVDYESMTIEQLQEMMDELVLTWDNADILTTQANEITDQALIVMELDAENNTEGFIKPTTQVISFARKNSTFVQPLTLNVNNCSSVTVNLLAEGRDVDPETWAENLTKKFDAIRGVPAAMKHKELAAQLGIDTKTACEQMRLAQKIIHNAADVEEFQAEVNAYTRSIKIVQGYKTTSKVGLLVTATIATGGGSLATLGASSMTIGQTGAVLVGGADCIVDVATTSSTIILGEDHQVTTDFANIQNKLAPISFVVGLATFNAGETGEQLAYIGDTLTEWYYNNKILGITVSGTDNGETKVTTQPIDISELDKEGIKSELEKAGFTTPEEGNSTLSSIIEEYRNIVEKASSKMVTLEAEMAAIMEEYNSIVPEPAETAPIEKKIVITIKNTSDQACYLDAVSIGYFDDCDGVFIDQLVVDSGGTARKSINVETSIEKGTLLETSPTTYEVTYLFVWGALPTGYPEHKNIDTEDLSFYDLTFTGTYSTDIYNSDLDPVIEWDGSSFKQIKQ